MAQLVIREIDKGTEKICKKIGEEASEVVIAAMANKEQELVGEFADLLYHSLVLMEDKGIQIQDVFEEVMKRKGLAPKEKYKDSNSIQSNTDKIKSNE